MRTRKIALINQKGGSAKTTTSVNLAAALSEKKRKVLLIDLDPQASATAWMGCEPDSKALFELFTENVNVLSIVVKTDIAGVDVIPSSQWLMGLEKRLAQEVGAETILKHKLSKIKPGTYDYILIDCPPTLGLLTVNALCAVDEIIVPVESRIMAVHGLVQLLETIDVIKERLNPTLKISGIVPCRVDARTNHAKEVVSELKSNFKGMMFKTSIRENIRLAEAPSFSQPINVYDKKCSGTLDYRSLAQEVINQEKLQR